MDPHITLEPRRPRSLPVKSRRMPIDFSCDHRSDRLTELARSGCYADRLAIMKIATALFVALLAACSSPAPSSVQWRGQEFSEITSLKALPASIQGALGASRPGLEGVADAGASFNVTDVVDAKLPMRRFVLAGLSKTHALVAVEHGGRAHNVRVVLYELPDTEKEQWVLVGRAQLANLEDLVHNLSHKHDG